MKLFNSIKNVLANPEFQFYWFLFILIVPNVCLCLTESLSVMAKLTNVLLPLACYYFVMTLSKNQGKSLWLLFLFVFLGAFQIVLLYLFGQSIIAVDMFLNLMTTNSNEALELLDKLLPSIVIVVLLYVPALIVGTISLIRKQKLSALFLHRERKRSVVVFCIGLLALGLTYIINKEYKVIIDLYPVNVCYNIKLAVQRDAKVRHYHETSKTFSFAAKSTHPKDLREVYVMVIGETSRAFNWQLYGYQRETNPQLKKVKGLTVFNHVLTESNTTHKSVPMLLSAVSASNFDSIYNQKSIITAFKEAGYATAFFSNQRYNHSCIDFFGNEADTKHFIKEEPLAIQATATDDDLLELVRHELDKPYKKLFIVLHTYGSHFNYRERYAASAVHFKPDTPVDAKVKYRTNLINAYDNSIRYTDDFLARLIHLLEDQCVDASMLYTSDHGEDIFDDSRHLFLHASPIPSYYQIHVPFLLWMSDSYRAQNPAYAAIATQNSSRQISSSASSFPTMLYLAGLQTSYRNDSLSVVSSRFKESPRVYLNDHNQACDIRHVGLEKQDFDLFIKKNIR